jgi:excisionase family DNA binding protein
MPHRGILNMKTYTVSEAARAAAVDRRTLQRWIRNKHIPSPKAEIIDGRLRKSWTVRDIERIREYKKRSYWGRGIDRRTGKKAKRK